MLGAGLAQLLYAKVMAGHPQAGHTSGVGSGDVMRRIADHHGLVGGDGLSVDQSATSERDPGQLASIGGV